MAFTFILLTFVAMTIAVGTSESATIRVGLYNSIPDLNEDDLLSYKEMVEIEFNKFTQGVHAHVLLMQLSIQPNILHMVTWLLISLMESLMHLRLIQFR